MVHISIVVLHVVQTHQGEVLLGVDLGLLVRPAFEHPRHAIEQGTFPLVDHPGMHPEPAGKLGGSLLALQGLQRNFRLLLGA